MSVRRWKQIISITIVLIIVILSVTSIMLAMKYKGVIKEEENVIEIADAVRNGDISIEEYDNLLKFLKNNDTQNSISYQSKYENLFVENNYQYIDNADEKICYLTFDDGPDINVTPKILDKLKEYNIKATFFVIYNDSEEAKALYKRIVEEGHTIGIHTASHRYDKIYDSVEAYLEDFNKISEYVEEVTGVKAEIFRFPGGSVNPYNVSFHYQLIAEMLRRGYTYYDWNVSGEDAVVSSTNKSEIVDNVLSSDSEMKRKIVLLHDGLGHGMTAEALPEIIEALQEQGYKFSSLNKNIKPITFGL